jgi:ribosome biogenesis ATPase
MDGLESRRSVFVIAATNRPELIDPAMLRPGRLDKLLYVPLPTPDDRAAILKAIAKKVNLGDDVNLDEIARSSRADGYSGADCAALLREAGLAVLRDDALVERGFRSGNSNDIKNESSDDKPSSLQITMHHFNYAFNHVMPSVSRKDQAKYDRIRDRMARARSRGGVEENKSDEGKNDGEKSESNK